MDRLRSADDGSPHRHHHVLPFLLQLPPPSTSTSTSFSFSSSSLLKRIVLPCLLLLSSFLLLLQLLAPLQPLSILRSVWYDSAAEEACDYAYGTWVPERSRAGVSLLVPYTEDCPFLDPGFRCRQNGRNDTGYLRWRWQPHGCDLPRFNATELLERSRNAKIVFAGDSIGRNQWESLVCMLAAAVADGSGVYERYGNPISKHKGFLSIVFRDYNLSLEYYRAPFLVRVDRPPPGAPGEVRGALRLDALHLRSKSWADADVLVLNSGHWWDSGKTTKAGNYFQVGGTVNTSMDVKEAFRTSLAAVKLWFSDNPQLQKSYTFLSTAAPSHYRNGTWNDGGTCAAEAEPQADAGAHMPEPWQNELIRNAVQEMNTEGEGEGEGEGGGRRRRWKLRLLNVTYVSEPRKDGHPSSHREPGTPADAPEDCSHWCLPGVPDAWNRLLYAHLLAMGYDNRINRQ